MTDCYCGKPSRDVQTEYGEETSDRLCVDCHLAIMDRKADEYFKRAELLDSLRGTPKPKLGSPLRKDWFDAQKPYLWEPARKRNKCLRCPKRAVQKFPHMCADCTESHYRLLEWDRENLEKYRNVI